MAGPPPVEESVSASAPFPSTSAFLESTSAPISQASMSFPSTSDQLASIAISGSFSLAASGSGCCCGGGGGSVGSSGSCDPDTHTCESGECKQDGCCYCIPSNADMAVDIDTCCGSFHGSVPMSNGGSGCSYSGTFEMCGQTVNITVDVNGCSVSVGGGCIPTKNATTTCDCGYISWSIEWTAGELAGCPGC